MKKRLIGLTSLPVSRRAALIVGLLNNFIDKAVYTSALLLDTEGNQVPEDTPVFLSPTSGGRIKLPEWIDIRFLLDDLRSELADRLGAQDLRELQGKLSSFGLLEYSLANLIRRVVAAANRRKRAYPDEVALVDHDLRSTIFILFKSETSSEKRPSYPDNAPLPMPNQGRETSSADKLYFGNGYGPQGNILQDLYGPWAPEKLIVGPEVLGLSDNKEELHSFLNPHYSRGMR